MIPRFLRPEHIPFVDVVLVPASPTLAPVVDVALEPRSLTITYEGHCTVTVTTEAALYLFLAAAKRTAGVW